MKRHNPQGLEPYPVLKKRQEQQQQRTTEHQSCKNIMLRKKPQDLSLTLPQWDLNPRH
jgi:hypothetical protein